MHRASNVAQQSSREGLSVAEVVPRSKSASVLIPIFIASMVLPIIVHIGPLRLSPYRLLLIVMFFPCLLAWVSGKMGKVRAGDFFIIFYCFWAFAAIVVHHGLAFAIEPIGMLFFETVGSYFLARYLIRDAASFRYFVLSLVVAISLLIPFAIFETLTSINITLKFFDAVGQTFFEIHKDPRWGLDRVQGPFEHPIAFGVFCSTGFALGFYVLGARMGLTRRALCAFPSAFGTFLSLSSGPLSALVAQGMIMGWDVVLNKVKSRWKILISLSVFTYVTIDLLSNRDPIRILISYFAFNAHTAYNRINIWIYGSADVMRHPFFGVGFGDWERPEWMHSGSMDMFWLVHAIRYGLPGALFFVLVVLLIVVQVSRLKITDPTIADYRLGFMISIIGLSLAGWTVHYWNAMYCLFIFLVGSGVWMLDADHEPKQSKTNDDESNGKQKRIEKEVGVRRTRAVWTRKR